MQKYFLNTSGVPGLQPASEPGGVVVVITRRLGTFVIAGIKQGRGYLHLSSFIAAGDFSGHSLSIDNSILYCIDAKKIRASVYFAADCGFT